MLELKNNPITQLNKTVYGSISISLLNNLIIHSFLFQDEIEYAIVSTASYPILLLPNVTQFINYEQNLFNFDVIWFDKDFAHVKNNGKIVLHTKLDKNELHYNDREIIHILEQEKSSIKIEDLNSTKWIKFCGILASDKEEFLWKYFNWFYDGTWKFRGAKAVLIKLLYGKEVKDGGNVTKKIEEIIKKYGAIVNE